STFITAISSRETVPWPRSSHEEEKETLTLTALSRNDYYTALRAISEERQEEEAPLSPVHVHAGDGFTLTSHELTKLNHIDALIAALRADEKAGKKRRFISRQR